MTAKLFINKITALLVISCIDLTLTCHIACHIVESLVPNKDDGRYLKKMIADTVDRLKKWC